MGVSAQAGGSAHDGVSSSPPCAFPLSLSCCRYASNHRKQSSPCRPWQVSFASACRHRWFLCRQSLCKHSSLNRAWNRAPVFGRSSGCRHHIDAPCAVLRRRCRYTPPSESAVPENRVQRHSCLFPLSRRRRYHSLVAYMVICVNQGTVVSLIIVQSIGIS